jgi:hypothetical protein
MLHELARVKSLAVEPTDGAETILDTRRSPWLLCILCSQWDQAMKKHESTTGEKAAKELYARDSHALKLKAQREEEDRKLAEQIAANGTPQKTKK